MAKKRGGMVRREVSLEITHRREPVAGGGAMRAATADEDARTVEAVWTTGARVRRNGILPDGSGWGVYDEELSLDAGAVDLSRMNDGRAPLLDAHFNYSMADQLGTVAAGSARIEGGVGLCVFAFRDTPGAMEVFRSIVDGTVGNVSVGYTVQEYEVTRGTQGEIPLFRATKWTPLEVSMVPIGADAGAGVRSQAGDVFPCVIVNKEAEMADKDKRAAGAADTGTEQADAAASEVRTQPSTGDAGSSGIEQARAEGVRVERERASAIRTACRILGDEAERTAEDLIGRGITLDAARAAIIERAAARSAETSVRGHRVEQVGQSGDDPTVMVGRMAEAIASRWNGNAPSEQAREFVGLSLSRLAGEILEARGEKVRRMRDHAIIERALGTTDFPLLLQGAGDRMLMPAYDQTPSTYQAIARKVTNGDFRAKSLIRDGDFPTLLPLNEHGEIKEGAMSESAETVQLVTVGRRIRLTRQALINDDLGAFATLATKAGQSARRHENATVWGVITANTKLSDNVALFHSTHANLAGSGGAIAAATVGAGKKAIRIQTSKDGVTLNYSPRSIVVPAALETTVEQYLSSVVVPTSEANVVPASHKALVPVVEPLLDANSATAWYLFCDPAMLAAVVYAYLEGQEGPQMVQQEVSLTGIAFDVVLDFAAAPVEYRAAYKNAGA